MISTLLTCVQLPSRGFPYAGLLPHGWLTLCDWSEEDAQAVVHTMSFTQVIDELITRCASLPAGLTAQDLVLGDRLYLLYALRTLKHGTQYKLSRSCDRCAKTMTYVFLLTEIEMQTLDASFSEPFGVALPKSKLHAQLRLLRGHDEQLLFDWNAALRADVPPTVGVLACMLTQLGETSFPVARKPDDLLERCVLVSELAAQDVAAITHRVAGIDPGLDLTKIVRCEHCGFDQPWLIDIEVSFFLGEQA